jgi:transposase
LTDEQLNLVLREHLAELNQSIYGTSSERYKKSEKPKDKQPAKPRVRLPSERYPNVPVREIPITMDPLPGCESCGKQMSDSGMTEDSEQLTVIPKKYEILRFKRSIYRCSCQSCMKTAPQLPRIIEGSTYSDEMILDVVLSKYCDLIPMERYVAMADRGGLMDLPPNSLIDLTHKFAFFILQVYRLIEAEILRARVLAADETPHRMLEGSERKNWYLWGFSTPTACYLLARSTRSGDVAGEILAKSACEVLLTDVFSGYDKATREANLLRAMDERVLITNANCNAHARRYFFKPNIITHPEAAFYLDHYHEIYQINDQTKGKPPDEILKLREQMRPRFEAMKERAWLELPCYPAGSKYKKALNYYLENYKGLTYFLKDPEVPIDNNGQERLLRSHVVGRKTWYGTHSEQGAETAAILFSIVETCKLNGVNPREYFPAIVKSILNRQTVLTPSQWKAQL